LLVGEKLPVIAIGLALALAVAPAHFVWPKPGLVEEIDIPDVIQTDGVPVRLHLIRSTLPVQQLLQTYATAFDQAGFYLAREQKRIVAEPHLTALDLRTKISYSAIISPNPDGTSSCLLGEAALGKKRPPQQDFAALMPAAGSVMRVDQETGRVLTFTVRASIEEANAFYRETLVPAGFAPSPIAAEANVYVKGAERIEVLAKGAGNGATAVVLIQRRGEQP
jgi:hypothetical protein